jgi:hypothetical protein
VDGQPWRRSPSASRPDTLIRRASAAVTLLLFLAAGCGSDGIPVNSPSSPLGEGAGGLRECIPDPSFKPLSDGITVLDNRSKGTVTVEHVSFYGDQHLLFIQAVVVPIGYNLVGDVPWPPTGTVLPGVQWDKRVAAVGARVPPSSKRSFRNLVIEMRPTARKAAIAGVLVLYRENGQQYELRTDGKTMVVPNKHC